MVTHLDARGSSRFELLLVLASLLVLVLASLLVLVLAAAVR